MQDGTFRATRDEQRVDRVPRVDREPSTSMSRGSSKSVSSRSSTRTPTRNCAHLFSYVPRFPELNVPLDELWGQTPRRDSSRPTCGRTSSPTIDHSTTSWSLARVDGYDAYAPRCASRAPGVGEKRRAKWGESAETRQDTMKWVGPRWLQRCH